MFGQQPNIKAKTLTYLEDTLNGEALACKKCESYATQFTDQTLVNMSNTLAAHHKDRYNALLNYLSSHQ